MKVAVIGYGLIGGERVKALRQLQSEGIPIEKIGIYDPHLISDTRGLICYPTIESIKQDNPDWVIIATPHDVAAKIVTEVLTWDCKVLMEKPFGRSYREAESIYNSIPDINEKLFLGFNYRFFDPLTQLINDMARLEFGDIISIDMEIGHGGSPEQRKSWKIDPRLGGVDVLLDPGIHLLDLLPFMCFSPKPLFGKAWNGFWNNNMDEETHLILQDYDTIINLKSSIVKWASTFKVEIHGTDGYGIVNGRGRSYGPMTYVRGKRWGWMLDGKTQKESEKLVATSDCDNSFHDELDALLSGKNKYLLYPCSAYEALDTMELYEKCLEVIK